MSDGTQGEYTQGESGRRLACFAYLGAPNAELYAGVLAVFARAREEFQLNLRSSEVAERLQHAATSEVVDAALDQLCRWGNLEAFADNSQALSLEEYYRRHLYYQLTGPGVAVIRAIELFHRLIDTPAALQATALAAVKDRLAELVALCRRRQEQPPSDGENSSGQAAFDVAKASSLLDGLFSELDKLTDQAQEFFRNLQATVELRGTSVDAFLAFKERLVQYLERFLNQVVTVAGEAEALLDSVHPPTLEAMLGEIARHRTIDEIDVGPERIASVQRSLTTRWEGLVRWFVAPSGQASQADELRALARTGIREVAAAAGRLNQQRGGMVDRSSDLRRLAVWFAECADDRACHRLWRAAFALSPARHLTVNDMTLAVRDEHPIPPSTSWRGAPPVVIAPTLRQSGRAARSARTPRLIDNRAQLQSLREQSRREAEQLRKAQAALLTPSPRRISQLDPLTARALPFFLDLLGEALSQRAWRDERAEATSTDGSLMIRLWPTGDGASCRLTTEWGDLCGEDYWIEIRRTDDGTFPDYPMEPAMREDR